MFRKYFILLLLVHILGDFYFQTNNMAKKKETSVKWVIAHSLSYWAIAVVILVSLYSTKIFWSGTAIAGIHAVIDIAKHYYLKNSKGKNLKKERLIFFTDQAAHIITLTGAAYLLIVYAGEMKILNIQSVICFALIF